MATYSSWDKSSHWVRVYRARIRLKLERCRLCGVLDEWGTGSQLTLDHIFPRSKGGTSLMENATILCAEDNNRKGDGPAVYKVSLWLEEFRAPRKQKWSRFPVLEVPTGPWDEVGSWQPPRSVRGRRRAVVKALPEWARPYYEDFGEGEIPDWVLGVMRGQYPDEDWIPAHVRRLMESG